MNKRSSCSHTIFRITIESHEKECDDGENKAPIPGAYASICLKLKETSRVEYAIKILGGKAILTSFGCNKPSALLLKKINEEVQSDYILENVTLTLLVDQRYQICYLTSNNNEVIVNILVEEEEDTDQRQTRSAHPRRL
jgi:hypothetical protein